jgi:hypothetical protein
MLGPVLKPGEQLQRSVYVIHKRKPETVIEEECKSPNPLERLNKANEKLQEQIVRRNSRRVG